MLVRLDNLQIWMGENINGWGLPLNAESVMSPIELLRYGLVQPIPFVIPDGYQVTGMPIYQKKTPTTVEEIYQLIEISNKIYSVTAAQALLALDDAGLLDEVTQICTNHPVKAVQIWFAKAQTWERENPYVLAMALECKISDDQVDALFLAASKK